jgi:rubredoxin
MGRYACSCCGYLTLDEQPPGTFDICPVCWWEDDPVQFDDPDYQLRGPVTSGRPGCPTAAVP